ncbi:MAG TPA: ABC transporter permease [Chitinophagaceae bacterium]|jgi:ABC-type antimicrobial peptide transport system permease subunit
MLKNYFKTAWRNLIRNKAFSLINISGLALGIASGIFILLWVNDERSMDNFHKNAPNLYDVYERVFSEGKVEAAHWTPGVLANELKRSIPEIRYASGYYDQDAALFETENKFIIENGTCADSDFFKMFSYPLLVGTPVSALNGPDNIAISRAMAENFFGSPDAAFGKIIKCNNYKNFKISAIFENPPGNSSQKFDYVANWKYLLDTVSWLKEWIYRSPYTFIQLQPNANPVRVEAKIKNFLTAYLNGQDGSGFHLELGLQRYNEMYLNSNYRNGRPSGGRIEYVRLFSMVAIFVLLIACINFMNLATARSAKRAKEVGVRKVIGAVRRSLIAQFILEAILLAFFATMFALALVILLLPAFNYLTGKQITLPFSSLYFVSIVLGVTFLTGIISGSYPALFLSSLRPIKILKGSLKFSVNALWFRKGLVVFQFVLSIVMITGTMIIMRQVHYVQTINLGFDKQNLIYVPFQGQMANHWDVFRQQISRMPGIQAVTRIDQPPTRIGSHAYDMDWDGKNPATKTVVIHATVGYDFLKIMNLQLLQGRDFSKDFPTDTAAYIINESALKLIGYKDPIGRPLSIFRTKGHIIGVIKDFHFKSLHDPIEPLLINLNEHIDWGNALVKTEPGKTKEAIASLEKVCKQMEPKFPFTYLFVDDDYKKLYDSEQTVGRLSRVFAFLAIFISCLGLLGLTMFTSEQRTKEIGIRKVIGASVNSLVLMLSKDILQLIIISAVIAAPVAWWGMNKWLQDFAYRTTISWWIFIISGLLAIVIAIATISYQAIKAAMANPMKSLRTE